VSAALRYGFRVGIGQGRPDVYKEAIKFADEVTNYYKSHETVDYTTKLGSGRMRDIIGQLEQSAQIAFLQLMIDPSIPMEERMTIWSGVDELEPQLRLRTYDMLAEPLGEQLMAHPLGRTLVMADAFPEPPGIEAWRQQIALERQLEKEAADAARKEGVERK
jgi:hypothetical protein